MTRSPYPLTPMGNVKIDSPSPVAKTSEFGRGHPMTIVEPMMVGAKEHYIVVTPSTAPHRWGDVGDFNKPIKAADFTSFIGLNPFNKLGMAVSIFGGGVATLPATSAGLRTILSTLPTLPIRVFKLLTAKFTVPFEGFGPAGDGDTLSFRNTVTHRGTKRMTAAVGLSPIKPKLFAADKAIPICLGHNTIIQEAN